MAKFKFELEYSVREQLGKGASRRLRREANQVLGIVYGGEETPQNISLDHHLVNRALENEAIFSHILTLISNGKKQKVVLKDVQRHPFKARIMHMDFMRINENKAILMHVPLHFVGQDVAPGVVDEGGTVTHHMVEVEIKCLPRYLPEFIEIDLTKAQLNDVVHLSQLKMPEGVELVTVVHSAEDDLPVVSIHLPKRIVEEEAAPEGAETPSTGGSPEGSAENQSG